jgi:hypothetical protein
LKSRSSSLTIANLNVLGTGVELKLLNGDGLDPAHGLVAVAAAKFQVEGGNSYAYDHIM